MKTQSEKPVLPLAIAKLRGEDLPQGVGVVLHTPIGEFNTALLGKDVTLFWRSVGCDYATNHELLGKGTVGEALDRLWARFQDKQFRDPEDQRKRIKLSIERAQAAKDAAEAANQCMRPCSQCKQFYTTSPEGKFLCARCKAKGFKEEKAKETKSIGEIRWYGAPGDCCAYRYEPGLADPSAIATRVCGKGWLERQSSWDVANKEAPKDACSVCSRKLGLFKLEDTPWSLSLRDYDIALDQALGQTNMTSMVVFVGDSECTYNPANLDTMRMHIKIGRLEWRTVGKVLEIRKRPNFSPG